ncbi:MAG TPA: right-handed parallel beta-helix repeat-containing protein [Candidatus Acidoferrum sp.]|nr:right-handed parallel beta-helix repeat-containing protein [Candidatus Acidoferrum sp.]
MRKLILGPALALLLACVFVLSFNIQPVKAGIIRVPQDSLTIQGAINAANPGDTIYVDVGTYFENICLNKSVLLVGKSREGSVIYGNTTTNVVMVNASDATLVNFTIRNSALEPWTGIRLDHVSNCNVSRNNLTADNLLGLQVVASSYNVIRENTFSGNGIVVTASAIPCLHNTIDNNTVDSRSIVYLEDAENLTVNGAGQLILVNCRGITVSNSNLTHTSIGVTLRNSTNCLVTGNDMSGSYEAVSMSDSSGITIANNTAENNAFAIVLVRYANDSVISRNSISACEYGVYATLSSNISISENNFRQCTAASIELDSSSDSTVQGNNVTDSADGVYLLGSSNNTIQDNFIAWNNLTGIQLQSDSAYNTIRTNFIRENYNHGLAINYSCFNYVMGNYFIDNVGYGAGFFGASNNTIYHNNFENNVNQAIDAWCTNSWDNGYPSGGNYWSNYNGTDVYKGAYQDINGSDGIGDTHFTIDANSTDHYPLMGPAGSSTTTGTNVTVFPTENVGLIFDSVTGGGSTSVNETKTGPAPSSGFKLEGKYYDITTTASYSGNIEIRIIYDDTNMTLEEETNLYFASWNATTSQWVNITTYVDTINNVIYGETNHLSGHGVFSPQIHDVKVPQVTLSKTVVGQGFAAIINITVANPGDFDETFYVTAYADAFTIQTMQITVGNGSDTIVTLVLNSAGFAKANYTIQAVADTVSGETNTGDNIYPDGWLVVTISGDINGDFKVGPADFALLSSAYGSTPGKPKWNPNADITSDDKVGPADFAQLSAHYGQHYP